MIGRRGYALVTSAYWSFTLTDGALRMLVLLHFHALGYTALQLAFLFLLYEFFGVVTNLFGGWIGSHTGLKLTLFSGLALQVGALTMLSFISESWSPAISVSYVLAAQGLSGIAKDLTKMSSKSAVKLLVDPSEPSSLFRWVAVLTGSKNALKGAGFFLGGFLLQTLGFQYSLWAMAASLAAVGLALTIFLRGDLGRSKTKVKFKHLFSKSPAINRLSFARVFLFASRDVWFVVALPVFLADSLGWTSSGVGGFFAAWVIGYGFIQATAHKLTPGTPGAAAVWAFALVAVCTTITTGLYTDFYPVVTVLAGLAIFAFVFALNSAVHSYLILAYTTDDSVAVDVGFYYMANASGRLAGTLLSGLVFLYAGLPGTLAAATALSLVSAVSALTLPRAR